MNSVAELLLLGQSDILKLRVRQELAKTSEKSDFEPETGAVRLFTLPASDTSKCVKAAGIIVVQDPVKHTCSEEIAETYQFIRGNAAAAFVLFLPIAEDSEKSIDFLKRRTNMLEQSLEIERDRWDKPLNQELSRLTGSSHVSPAAKERIEQLRAWLSPPFHCTVRGPASLQIPSQIETTIAEAVAELKKLLKLKRLSFVVQAPGTPDLNLSDGELANLPGKSPTLHWTNWPTAQEIQLTWRFEFVCSKPPDGWFQHLISNCADCDLPETEYRFRWIDGLLLQFDDLKVCISRINNLVEVSARCDPDELSEEGQLVEELLWKFVYPHIHCVFQALTSLPSLPYQICLVPVGSTYYEITLAMETPFNLVSLLGELGANPQCKQYRFSSKNTLNEPIKGTLLLHKCFPGYSPKSLQDIRNHIQDLLRTPDVKRKQSDFATKLQNLSVGFAEAESSPSKRRVSCDRGRRVSFGHVLVEDSNKLSIEDEAEDDRILPHASNSTKSKIGYQCE